LLVVGIALRFFPRAAAAAADNAAAAATSLICSKITTFSSVLTRKNWQQRCLFSAKYELSNWRLDHL
jgi:hypothetical protein